MTHLEFLRSPRATTLLERAATGAGTPLSIHYVKRNQEGARVVGWGQCGACRAVSECPGGTMACRLSRTMASAQALQQQRPIPYMCHLGFACVAVAPFEDEGYVITMGPYCPMEEQRSLEDDVRAGMTALLGEGEEVPSYSLDDVHRAPASAVPTVAGWLQELLREAWAAAQTVDEGPKDENIAPTTGLEPHANRGYGPATVARTDILAREMAAALSAESHARARSLLQGQLEELGRGQDKNVGVRRARVAALIAATLEALARTGVSLDGAWRGHEAFVRGLPSYGDDRALLDGAMGVFSFLRRKANQEERASALPQYPELYNVVKERLLDGITLDEVARELGETPSAISHRLKRKFGMSFSEYMGRIRIDKAKQFFRRTQLSATEVAGRVGIADQSNFAKLFKKMEGMSPTEYKKKHGKGP